MKTSLVLFFFFLFIAASFSRLTKTENCNLDETKNRYGAHQCDGDSECTGKKTCSDVKVNQVATKIRKNFAMSMKKKID